jgi:hypothetical protein
MVELMQEWTRVKRDAGAQDLSLALVVDGELFRLDSVIRWLDAAESRLRRAGVEPPPVPDQVAPQRGVATVVVPTVRAGVRR